MGVAGKDEIIRLTDVHFFVFGTLSASSMLTLDACMGVDEGF